MTQFLRAAGLRGWLTGGTVRDLLLGREPGDIDVVIAGDPEPPARRFADATGGSYFSLSEEFQTCRVVSADRLRTYDFAACRGNDILDDLRYRDFTINALAVELPGGGSVIDPLGGQADLAAQRLAAVSNDVFERDPLRLLRGLRLEQGLGFTITGETEGLIRRHAHLADRPAPERVYAELIRFLPAPGAAPAVRRLDDLGLLPVIFPEIEALKGVVQNDYHHLDVFEHTLAAVAVMDRQVADPAGFFPKHAGRLQERSGLEFGGGATRGFVLGFAELMHDVAKPGCAFVDQDGQIRFFEHERKGAEAAARILRRLRAGSKTIAAVGHLIGGHMRFEGLLHLDPLTPRARLRYLRATAPLAPESIMMAVADRLSVRGRLVNEADVSQHLALAREMMDAAFAAEDARPLPRLVDGDELMLEFNLKPGPGLGALLDHIEEEQALGKVGTREEAIAAAASFLKAGNAEKPRSPGM